jgi:DNA processing protein
VPLSESALEPLLRLALVTGIGPQKLAFLIGRYGSAEGVLAASARELALLPGMSAAVVSGVREQAGAAGTASARTALQAVRRAGAVALTQDDPDYPQAFRVVTEPPYLLFAAGRLDLLDTPAVAVVGTRSPTRYGREAAAAFVSGLVRHGYAVVSGMARGIDSAAHEAALDAAGVTFGILGHGIDVIYPPESRGLFDRVRERGLLLSEFVPSEKPRAGNFPRRNRLIAALCQGVVVVEMGLKSGAQHTVNYALELGKEVMAVPGHVDSPQSEGTNQLIREGARAVTCAEEVIEELEGVSANPTPRRRLERHSDPLSLPLLDPAQDAVFQALRPDPKHIDRLGEETGLMSGVLLATLLDLELRGVAEALPGKRYRRA